VRAGKNLFRPAHIFSFLKQGNYDALSRATNFLIDRQFQNKSWNFSSKTPHKYSKLTEELCYSFAEFTAQLEREYIFTWLEWDGDNVLSDAGIIDYGSIRQFGLRHDHYKYDDVERFSTNLSGQRNKAKKIIQTFIQLTDFLKSKQKKPLSDFENSKILKNFDEAYDYFLVSKFLKQVGLEDKYINVLMRKYRKDMNTFYQSFLTLEKQKSSEPLKKVEDGVNRTPLFNMRRTLIDIPESILNNKLDLETILYNTVTELAPESDKKHSEKFINNFQIFYKMYDSTLKTVTKEFNNHSRTKIIKSIVNNSKIHNAQNRLTGNALISIVNELIHAKKKGLPHSELQKIIDHLIVSQVSVEHKRSSKPRHKKSKKLMNTILTLIDGFKEDI